MWLMQQLGALEQVGGMRGDERASLSTAPAGHRRNDSAWLRWLIAAAIAAGLLALWALLLPIFA